MSTQSTTAPTLVASLPATAAPLLGRDALAFIAELERRFGPRRRKLLAERARRRTRLAAGELLGFLEETRELRAGDWTIVPNPRALADRRVEITGPVDRKMVINALNSGANGFMACFEDATAPTWENLVAGQRNLFDAVRGELSLTTPEGRTYELGDERATLHVRPRGWHLDEPGLLVDGAPVAGALFDAGLFLLHNARELVARGAGPFLYLPKLESHREAALWRDVFVHVEDALELSRGTIRATVLIETFPAAFEMDEISFELREHLAGLNAGRWDYIFSAIKSFADQPAFVQPERNRVTMTVSFMRAYAELLVATCHRRGAHAIGGMSAFIPSRALPDVTERALAKVREDKDREARAGYDGTWVAHPDLVPVARAAFDAVLDGHANQLERRRDDVRVSAEQLLDVRSAGDVVTHQGVRANVAVTLEYVATWLAGAGAVAIDNLMEDAATAEISRSQLWQWIRHGVETAEGERIDGALVRGLADQETARLRTREGWPPAPRLDDARRLFDEVTLGETFVEFLTIPGMALLRGVTNDQSEDR